MASTHLAKFRAARHRAVCACALAPISLGALLSAHAGAGELAPCGAMPADQMVADCDVVAAGGELQREYGGRAATMSTPLGNAVCGHSRVYLREFVHPALRTVWPRGTSSMHHTSRMSDSCWVRNWTSRRITCYRPAASGILRQHARALPQELLQSFAFGAVRRLVPGMMLPFSTTLDRQAYRNYWLHVKVRCKGKGKGKAQQQCMLMGPRF